MTVAPPEETSPLAIVAGGGSLPGAVAADVTARGRDVVMFGLAGWADPDLLARHRHHRVRLAGYGRLRRLMREEGCREVVVIGSLLRPSFASLRPDWATLVRLPRVWRAYRGGDDHLLTSVGRILEDDGFRLRGAHEVAPSILVPPGRLGRASASPRDEADIAIALDLLAAMSRFDVGQAVVVAARHVLAVEAAEGTDRMLARIAELREAGRIVTPRGVGVLVKAAKIGQDRRFDLPTIGPATADGVARAGLAGLAVPAGDAIVAEPEALTRRLDAAGLFGVGLPAAAR